MTEHRRERPELHGFRALLGVSGHGERFRLAPGMNNTPSRSRRECRLDLPRPTLARRRLHDGPQPEKDEQVDLKVLVKPLINLIWAAGFLFVAAP